MQVCLGQNHTDAFLFETNYQFQKNTILGRLKQVQKSGHEFVLDHDDEGKVFQVGAYSFGYVRDLVKDKGIYVRLGRRL